MQTNSRGACFGGKSHRETQQRAAVSRASRHLEEKVPSDRIYTRQQRPSWQVNILVLVRASNTVLLCDGDVVSSLVFRFSHPKPYPFALVRTSFILRPHPPLTSERPQAWLLSNVFILHISFPPAPPRGPQQCRILMKALRNSMLKVV